MQAVILAAGRGTRLQPLTDTIPKAMVPVNGKPILEILLNQLSSAGIKECSYLGIPAVNIGTRQNNRLRSHNVIDTRGGKKAIKNAIKRQLEQGKYKSSALYHANGTSKKIASKLATIPLYIQKSFTTD